MSCALNAGFRLIRWKPCATPELGQTPYSARPRGEYAAGPLWYSCPVNVERTIQFILESQTRAEARVEKADARTEKADARMEKNDARVAAMEKRLDRRMDAITKLLQQGMRMLAKTDTELAELAVAQKELAAA